MTTLDILKSAKAAAVSMSVITSEQKNNALLNMADAIEQEAASILAANQKDLSFAEGKMSQVMLDRLRLTTERIKGMADGIREVTKLPEPVGRVLEHIERPNGLKINKVSVPMGVVGMIYESRPNVTSDAASLALKSGNVCVLRSGKEAFFSSDAIVEAMRKGLIKTGLSPQLINLIQDTSRDSATEMMQAVGYIDLLIPRGGAGLINAVVQNAKVPCIQTGTGICHVYVDQSADLNIALNIVNNAKTSRPSVCNAEEVLLVNKKIAPEFLPMLKKALCEDRKKDGLTPVELRLCPLCAKIIDGTPAGENDFDTEFLDYILAVKIVNDVNEAIEHIAAHSTHHSDCIVTSLTKNADMFTSLVDSAAVYVNASTRFTDGGEFGLGCEIGISTQKLHARGPMGLCALTTTKYVIVGNGQLR